MKNDVPTISKKILRLFLPKKDREYLMGDYAFLYNELRQKRGKLYADFWYLLTVIKSIPSFLRHKVYWGGVMLSNYFKVAFRNIKKQKAYSLINISGLSIGLASCIIITLWIMNQLSVDKFHNDSENIYMVFCKTPRGENPSTPWPLSTSLKDEIPEIEYSTRFNIHGQALLKYGGKVFYENNISLVDSDFFRIFSFPFITGDAETAFNDVYSMVITKQIAEKYFGNEDPLGKIITFNNEYDMKVGGVIENIPENSTLRFDILIPVDFGIATNRTGFEMGWGWWSPNTFVKVKPNISHELLSNKIEDFLIIKKIENEPPALIAIPFSETYMYFTNAKNYIYIFSAIAVFILCIACINFVNLSTARSSMRMKEIGMRKVSGAFRKNLVMQFLSESLLLSFGSLVFAVLIVYLVLPYFNEWFDANLYMNFFENINLVTIIILMTVFTGLIAGSYPALYLSSLDPVKIIKGDLKTGNKGVHLKRALVIVQFVMSVILITSTGIIQDQLNFLNTSGIGYETDNLLKINLEGETRKNFQIFKNELLQNRKIITVSGTADGLPFFNWSSGTCEWEGKTPDYEVITYNNYVDYDFFMTFGIEIIAGRNFLRERLEDLGWNFIINEEMKKVIGVDNPVGMRLTYWGNQGQIIGVAKNFHFQSFYNKLGPLVLMLRPDEINVAYIRIIPSNTQHTIDEIKEIWDRVNNGYPFRISYLGEQIEQRYGNVDSFGKLINCFAFLAIFTACLGLLGLASFTAEQKTKEIGIRKVLGAPTTGIVLMLIKQFVKWVLVANIIAWPITYYIMLKWTNEFVYKADLNTYIFIISGIIVLLLAVITVSFQSIKAGIKRPVETLKYE